MPSLWSRSRPAAIMLAFAITAVGCSGSDSNEEGKGGPKDEVNSPSFGPLAVADGEASGSEALTSGELLVSETCVLLRSGGEEWLLVWPSDATRWDARERTIVYRQGDGASVTLKSGDVLSLGGGGSSVAEDGTPSDEWVSSISWAAEPKEECLRDQRWFVGSTVEVT